MCMQYADLDFTYTFTLTTVTRTWPLKFVHLLGCNVTDSGQSAKELFIEYSLYY
jgi:hypothetical protein